MVQIIQYLHSIAYIYYYIFNLFKYLFYNLSGQTGAGKTYTILGNLEDNSSFLNNDKIMQLLKGNERGILPRALCLILQEYQKKAKKYKLFISFYEVYNEKIYDLFNGSNQKDGLEIREFKNGEVQIPDLIQIQINDINQALDMLIIGLKNRATGQTMANSKSSRSHSIFQIQLQHINGDKISDTYLKIVDLAGSEKFKIPHDISNSEKELRIQELTCINGSLSSLGHCITALTDKKRTHIPFRNSKLTRVLSDSLSGKGKIAFIVCISPSMSSSQETFSTLQFANRAKRAILDSRNLKNDKFENLKEEQISLKEHLELKIEYNKEIQLREKLQQILKDLKDNNDYD
ncbi:kinesin-like protein, putative, partial [Ichthyophthirius multifiliis]